MSFPRNIAEKVLLDCKRSCAVCHKFCGTKIELHHIKPKSDGGEDSYDNCIPLCFDCHAEVGAYNPRHPKGNKYTERELKEHRNKWFTKVKGSNDFDAVKNIVLPEGMSDPAIQKAIILLISKTIGRNPTQQEIELALNKAEIKRGSEQVSPEDFTSISGRNDKSRSLSSNPYYFPKISETTLKKHIDLKVEECPFRSIIERITLYQGVVNHYQLIIEAPITYTAFIKIQNFWEREMSDLFDNHFVEIYHDNPEVTFRYEKGSFWHDWSCLVTDSHKELPDGLVNQKYKWILYEK